jgi:transcriptional regulator with XRE-family HTH domain
MEALATYDDRIHNPAMNLGEKLKKLVKARGMTREELLSAVNGLGVELSKSALGNYFADINKPQLEVALALARVLAVPLDYLADDAMDDLAPRRDELTPDEAAVLSHYRVQRRKEGPAFDPDELAWRIANPRVDYGIPIQDVPPPGEPGRPTGGATAKGVAGNGG